MPRNYFSKVILSSFCFLFCFTEAVLAEGTFELLDGNASNLPIRIVNAGGAPTYLRVDIEDPSTEVIDIFTQNIGSPDITIWCPGQIDIDAAAQATIPAPDFTADVSNTAGQIANFADVMSVQTIAGRPRPPVSYSLTGSTPTCGQAGTYTIRLSNNVENFDIAVRNTASNTLSRGRLFSYYWGFNGRTFNNFFRGTFFVVSGSDLGSFYEGLVWEMDLNGIRPFVFEMLSNSNGVSPLQYNSQSVHSTESPTPFLVPEFPLYVNQPEKQVNGLPDISSTTLDLDFDTSCDGGANIQGANFEFEVQGAFTYQILVDEDGDGEFEPSELIVGGVTTSGVNVIPWNAILPSGNTLASGQSLDYQLRVTGGEVHFPFRDVEFAIPGPLITLQGTNPGSLSDLYFWDDRDPSVTSTAGGGSTSLPAGSLTPHQWQNGVDGYRDQNFIDTWKFDAIEIETSTASATCPVEVDLEISKSQSPATLIPGNSVTYTIEVVNNGVVDANGATVTDTLDPILTTVSWTCAGSLGANCANASGTGNLNESENIPVDGRLEYVITASIPADATGTLANTASVAPPAGIPETDSTNNSATVSALLTAQSDLIISKSHSPTPFVAGSPGQWTITVTNNGPSDAPGVLVNDTFPADFNTPVWTCSVPTGVGSCSAAGSGNINESIDLNAGASAVFVVSGTIPAGSSAAIINTATLTHPNDTDAGNNTAMDNATIDILTDLVVAKTHSPDVFIPGAPGGYEITVSNAGPSNASGIAFTDTPPVQLLNPVWTCSVTTGVGSCSVSSGTGEINITIDLDNGAEATVALTGNVDPTTTTSVSNSVSATLASDNDPDNNIDTTVANVDIQVDLGITKVITSGSTIAGSTISYEVVVTNTGPSFASAASVSDALSSAIVGATWNCSITGTGTCGNPSGNGSINEIVNLAPNASATFQISGTISPSASGDLVNSADVSHPEEINPVNNQATVSSTIITQADISVSKSHLPDPVVPGAAVVYQVVVSNAGPSDVFGVSVEDTLPAELLNAEWTCSVAGAGACSSASGLGDISETLDLAVGSSATFEINAEVEQHVTASFSNTASAEVPAGVSDPNSANDSSIDNAAVDVQVDLSVLKSHSPASPIPGTSFTWTIDILNTGPSAASEFNFTDIFPAAALNPTWTCSVDGVGSCPAASGSGDINNVVMSLDANTGAQFIVTATLDPSFSGTFTNTATASHPEDTNLANNSFADIATANVQADLSLTKSHSPSNFIAGAPAIWTLRVANAGPSNVSNVTVTDSLPSECFSPTWACSVIVGSGNCDEASGSGSVNTTVDMNANSVIEFEIDCIIDAGFAGISINDAEISHPDDVFSGNNVTSDSATVLRQGDVSVVKTFNPNPVVAGEQVSFTIVVSNNGPSDLSGITVSDTISSEIISPTWTCAITGNGSCANVSGTGDISEIVDLESGSSATYVVTGTLSSSSVSLNNAANVSHPDDTSAGNNSSAVSPSPSVEVDLAIGKSHSPNPFVAGTPAQYTVQVTNSGPSDAVGVNITDILPAEFAGASWTCVVATGTGACSNATGSGDINETVDISASSSVEFIISATIPAGASGVISNSASASHPSDTSPGNDTAEDPAPVQTVTGIGINKSHTPMILIPGLPVQYTVVVTNSGPSTANGISVVDTLPAELLSVTWNCSATSGGSCANASGSGNINETVNLPPNASATYLISAIVDPATTSTVTNAASVSHPSDSDMTNNTASDPANIDIQADISITKISSPNPATPGEAVSYTITVANAGPSAASEIAVADVFPEGLSAVTWNCAVSTGTGACTDLSGTGDIATTVALAPSSQITFSVTALIDSTSTGSIVNTASFSYPDDITPGDEMATEITSLVLVTNIVASKNATSTEFIEGQEIGYQITVRNDGPSFASGVLISDPLNSNTLNASWTCSVSGSGSCSTPLGIGVVSVLVDLESGETATIDLTAELSFGSPDNLVNSLFITADSDPDVSNNAIEISTPVTNLMCGEPSRPLQESFPWNGFLGQTNILTLSNRCDRTVDVVIDIFDIDGNLVHQQGAWIFADGQEDIILNELPGIIPDSYGSIQVNYIEPDCIDSIINYYGSPDDFQSTLSGSEPLTGESYGNFNTFQLSTNPADSMAQVFNWLQINNTDPLMSRTFTKVIYDLVGNISESETVVIPPLGRVDLQAGHIVPGPSNSGLVAVFPEDPDAEYFAQLARYGMNGAGEIVFSTIMNLSSGSVTNCEWVNISSGAGAANWLTVSNTSALPLSATVKLVDPQNVGNIQNTNFTIEAFGQRAIDASAFLLPGSSGFAEICRVSGGSFTAESAYYYFSAQGDVNSVTIENSHLGRCDIASSQYNTFFGQRNFLRLTNPGMDSIQFNVTVSDLFGASLGTGSYTIFPNGGIDINLESPPFTVLPDTYGQVEIVINTNNSGFIIGDLVRVTFAPDGTVLNAEIYPLN